MPAIVGMTFIITDLMFGLVFVEVLSVFIAVSFASSWFLWFGFLL